MSTDRQDSATDLFTNYLQIGRLTPESSNPRPWLGLVAERPPASEFSVFLHEVTHHWCFLTPVNFAIAVLIARARVETAAYLEDTNGAFASSPFVDIAGAHACMHLLKPANEGLALFAEFDMSTRLNSRVISRVMDMALLCYSRPDDWDYSLPVEWQPVMAAAGLLHTLRTSDETLSKRASLLLRPLDPAQDPYLIGYLSVKSLFRTLGRVVPRLKSEPDLCLMYLRSYLFEDAGLVCALLEPALDPSEIVERVIGRLSDRLNGIDDVTPADIDAFETFALANDDMERPKALQFAPGLRVGGAAVDRAKELLDEQDRYWTAAAAARVEHSVMSTWVVEVLNQRHNATLITADVMVDVGSTRKSAAVRDSKGHLLDLLDDDLLGDDNFESGPARLDIVVNMARTSRAAILSRDGRIVACRPLFTPQSAARTRSDAVRWFREQDALEKIASAWRSVDAFLLQPESPASPPIENARNAVLPFWGDVALRYARDYEAIDTCTALMREHGFYPLLKSSSLVQRTALIGLAVSISVQLDHARAMFLSRGWDLEATLQDLASVAEEKGFPPAPFVVEGTIYTSI